MFTLRNSMAPSLVHSLVDSFFECKKSQVKQRMRDSMEQLIDELFGELVGQVKEMLVPVEETPKSTLGHPEPLKNGKSEQVVKEYASSLNPTKPMSPESQILAIKSIPSSASGIKRNYESLAVSNDSDQLIVPPNESIKCDTESVKSAKKCKIANQVGQIPLGGDEPKDTTVDIPAVSSGSKDQATTPHKYACQTPGCGKSFARSDVLKNHQKAHSNVKPFICKYPECTHAGKTRYDTLRHIANVHLKNSPDDQDPKKYLEVDKQLLQ